MKSKQNKKAFKLSYESDGKMGKDTKTKNTASENTEFFNTTQSSE
ncbi:hypothetical protein [Bacillus sp. 165]|nr:hypothetical protein [Bacillus sp. 165]